MVEQIQEGLDPNATEHHDCQRQREQQSGSGGLERSGCRAVWRLGASDSYSLGAAAETKCKHIVDGDQ